MTTILLGTLPLLLHTSSVSDIYITARVDAVRCSKPFPKVSHPTRQHYNPQRPDAKPARLQYVCWRF